MAYQLIGSKAALGRRLLFWLPSYYLATSSALPFAERAYIIHYLAGLCKQMYRVEARYCFVSGLYYLATRG